MLKTDVNKIKLYWKKYGTLKLITKAIRYMCRPVFLYMPHNFYGVRSLPQTQLRACCPLEIRKGTVADTKLIVKMLVDMDEASACKQIEDYFNSEGEVFLAFSEGKLVHVAWLHYHPGILKAHPLVVIREDEAYIGRCDTHPEFRGLNIYPVVLQHIIRYAFSKNKRRCFISTLPTHLSSIRGIEKAGFSFVGRIRVFRLFGKTFNNRWKSSKIVNLDQEE